MKKRLNLFKKTTCLLGILFILLGLLPVPVLSSVGRVFAQDEIPPAEQPAPAEEPAAETPAPPAEEPAAEPPAEEPAAEPPAEGEPTGEAPAEEVPMEPTVEAILETLEGETELEDLCPEDPLKTEPGACGCGFVDEDLNGDGVADCNEVEPEAGENYTAEVQALAEVGAVLVDASGNEVPLASEDAAEILATADPYFTSGGTKYCFVPSLPCDATCGECTVSATPIQDAVNAAGTHTPTDGTIYVLPGVYSENVTIAVNNLTLMGDPGDPTAAGAAVTAPILRGDDNPATNDVGLSITGSNISIIGFIIEKFNIGIDLQASGSAKFTAENNTIRDNGIGVKNSNSVPTVDLHYNIFKDNGYAILNVIGQGGQQIIHAENNYWNCDCGPVVYGCAQKQGNNCVLMGYFQWPDGTYLGTTRPANCEVLYGDKINHWDFQMNTGDWKPYKIILDPAQTAPEPFCGDGEVNGSEPCDPTASPTGAPTGFTCSETCTLVPIPSLCGNSVLNAGETCDPPGSQTTGGVCRDNCTFCGDGVTQGDYEQCDGGATCTAQCTWVTGCTDPNAYNYNANAVVDDGSCIWCGDGTVNGPEECDGGATCTAQCTWITGCTNPVAYNFNPNAAVDDGSCIWCGDGAVNGPEPCDYSATPTGATPPNTCSQTCTIVTPSCGDGTVTASIGETCDPPGSQTTGEICRDDCTFCGDGVVQGNEQCDGGATCTAQCTWVTGCTNPDAYNYNANAVVDDGSCIWCGDGTVNGPEECDGGATCTAQCTWVTGCTNPVAYNYNANAAVDDGSCIWCGDGAVNGPEPCDWSADPTGAVPPDLCSRNCTIIPPACGDQKVDPGETCDPPGSATAGLACRDDCTFCGDLVVQAPEECDGGKDCLANCTLKDVPPPPPPPGGAGGPLLIPVTGPIEEPFIIPVTGLDMNFRIAGLQTLSLYMGMLLFGVTLVLEGLDRKQLK